MPSDRPQGGGLTKGKVSLTVSPLPPLAHVWSDIVSHAEKIVGIVGLCAQHAQHVFKVYKQQRE